MKTKLTLSVDSSAIAQAKRLAKRRGVSVSALFEQWTTRMADPGSEAPFGQRLRGRWKQAVGESGEDPRFDYLMEKHGRG